MLELIELFILDRTFAGLAPGTLKWYKAKLQKYQAFMGQEARGITKQRILEFLQGLGCTEAGRFGYWRTIRAYHRWAFQQGYLPDLTTGLHPRFVATIPRATMPHETILRLLATIPRASFTGRRDFALYATIYYTGARESEILNLQRDHVDLANRSITVLGKGNKVRAVPIAPVLARLLAGYLGHVPADCQYLFPVYSGDRPRDRPLDVDYSGHRWRAYQRAAGIARPWRVHDLRHACATRLYEQDVDLADIQYLLGHSTIAVTQIYAQKSNPRLKRNVDRVFG